MGSKSLAVLALSVLAAASPAAVAADWDHWRGPTRDGVSPEKGLPTRWSPTGENLVWRASFGARSGPVVVGDRLYVQNAVGSGDQVQERVVCLDADTGKQVWEHRFNVFHTDVPPHRLGWASPTVDAATGNVYAFGIDGQLLALSPAGKLLWDRSLTEEFGAITTHGGRTVSPFVEGDLLLVSALNSGWGDQARGSNRYFAFDKKTGETVWVATPQARHYDTNYSNPIAATIDGTRVLVVGGTDGAIHAIKVATGEPVWKYEMSKRSINTNPLVRGTTVYVTHSEENYDTSEMGQIAAIDGTAKGEIGKAQIRWRTDGFQGGYSSPVMDAERLYVADNGAVLGAFDLSTGKKLWDRSLGTIQKASLVWGDGKLYVGTENGRFYILKPGPAGVEVLDEDLLGTQEAPEAIIAPVAVSRGRIYLASMDGLYCIGKKAAAGAAKSAPAAALAAPAAAPAAPAAAPAGDPAWLQVRPAEVLVKPGERVRFRARLYDAQGRFVREDDGAAWSLDGLKGEVAKGELTTAADSGAQGGLVKATAGALSGTARVRVIPPLPWSYDFDGSTEKTPPRHWINATGKFVVRDRVDAAGPATSGAAGGVASATGNGAAPAPAPAAGKMLVKLSDNPFLRRARVFLGPPAWSDYTVEADVLATEKRRQMGDAGVIAQRYVLTLFGNSQRLDLQPWQANAARTIHVPFKWKPNTWYRLKLRVENASDGTTKVQGKAWPAADAEPAAWTVEHVDRLPHRNGAPGLYVDAPNEVMFDNVKVTPNS
jgi:outer membrane protein assembly factor BamB